MTTTSENEAAKAQWNYTYANGGGDSTRQSKPGKVANIYQAQGLGVTGSDSEYLSAVMVGVRGSDIDINISVYTNLPTEKFSNPSNATFDPEYSATGEPAMTGYYHADITGMYTIQLDDLIELRKGTYFSIVVTTNRDVMYDTYVDSINGHENLSYWLNPYDLWQAAPVGTASIKALTVVGEKQDFLEDLEDGCTINFASNTFSYIVSNSYTSNRNNKKGVEPAFTVKSKNGKVVNNRFYTISYNENVNVSTSTTVATVTIEGKGLYKGSITKTFEITPYDISNDESITVDIDFLEDDQNPDGSVTYKGSPFEPTVYLYRDGNLIDEAEYDAKILNNVNVGRATIEITGKRNFQGTLEIEDLGFDIVKAEQPELETTVIESIPNNANKVGHVPLPSGWVWENPNQMLTVGYNHATAIYGDSGNYNVHPVEMTIIVRRVGDGSGFDDPGPTEPATAVEAFVAEVGKIAGETSLSAKYTRIKSAYEKWTALSEEERAESEAQSAYETLTAAISSYNTGAEAMNEAHVGAIDNALNAMSSATIATVSVLAAVWYIGKATIC